MTASRVHSASHSSILQREHETSFCSAHFLFISALVRWRVTYLCEVIMMALPDSLVRVIASQSSRLATGSMPVDGSSRKITGGPPIRAMPALNFLLLPPLCRRANRQLGIQHIANKWFYFIIFYYTLISNTLSIYTFYPSSNHQTIMFNHHLQFKSNHWSYLNNCSLYLDHIHSSQLSIHSSYLNTKPNHHI